MSPRPIPRFRSLLRGAVFALAVAAGIRLLAGQAGTNHPASGPYAPDIAQAWGTATWPLGAAFTAGPGSTLQVGVYSAHATVMVLEIYQSATGADAAYDYAMTKGPDNIWRAAVATIPAHTLYAFRAWGPNWTYSASWTRGNSAVGFVSDCDAAGNRFNPNKVLFDPYARELANDTWSPAMQAAGESYSMYTSGGTNSPTPATYTGPLSGGATISARNVDDGHWAPKAVVVDDHTPTGPKPNLAQKDAIIYETHVKGLTAHPSSVNLTTLLNEYSGFQDAANVPDNLRGTYAGAAYMAGYLKDLGFNTVEFLPIHETSNAANPTTGPSSGGGGYWGYYTYGFFAPDRRYASDQSPGGPTAEFKAMVASFHAAGIEVYLDVVYNHTGEGGVWDSNTAQQAEITFFRGLDNASYYTLVAGTLNGPLIYYWVSTGVGTNVNGGSAPAANLITDSLAYWANTMGVDGFRFDEAVELGRNGALNFSSTSPLLQSIATLAGTDHFKIIAEPWDVNDGGEIGNFPAGWACWNGNYRDSIRMFMTGNISGYVYGAGNLGPADAFNGDPAKMTAEGGPQKSVNFIVCHDGFNITDLVSYAAKTNAGLTWPFGPSDGGTDNNLSSTWGGNQALRRQTIRNFWTFQVLSRGLPMMVWGDEFGRTMNGNNNAYNIDSVATWNNYNMIATNSPDTVATGDLTGGMAPYANNLGTFSGSINGNFAFLQYLLHLRAAHGAFRQSDFTSMPITFASAANGTFTQGSTPTFAAYVHGSAVGDDDFLVLNNLATASATCVVPTAPANTRWARIIDTNTAAEGTANFWSPAAAATVTGSTAVAAQSIVVLEAVSLNVAPTITLNPLGQTATAGAPVTFTAAAAGTPAPALQWQKGTTAIPNATGTTFTLNPVAPGDAGSYTMVATNAAGSATSAAAVLTVDLINQTITFAALPDVPFGPAPVSLSASSDSGLPVAFAVVSGPATVTGSMLTVTGTGVVTVEATASAGGNYAAAAPVDRTFTVTANFASWQQAVFTAPELTNAALTGPTAVYGRDGLPNLVKYALGLDPKRNVTAGLPTVSQSGGTWVYAYTRPVGLGDVSYTVETSADLATWTPVSPTDLGLTSANGVDTCTATIPLTAAKPVFFHLKISQ